MRILLPIRSVTPLMPCLIALLTVMSKCICLVLPFRETEFDSYFTAFERVAAKLKWPKDMWALLLQSNFVGKAQEVSAALPIEQALDCH